MSFSKWLSLALVALLTVLEGCGRKQPRPAAEIEPAAVKIIEVSVTDTDVYAEYAGQLFAKDKVDIRARVAGHIEQRFFQPGQEVETGHPLYMLDLRPLKAQLQQAQGTLKQAQADLSLARRQAALREAEAKVHADDAEAEKARLNADLQVQFAQGRVEAQLGAVDAAAHNVSNGTIRAPIGGRVGDAAAQIGSPVDPNSPQALTTISPLDPIQVRFHMTENQYLSFLGKSGPADRGSRLQLVLADKSVYSEAGHVVSSLKQVEPGTGTVELLGEFPNPRHWLLPGQFARVRYVTEHRKGAVLVPLRAVLPGQDKPKAIVVGEGDRIEMREVTVGPRVGDSLLIDEGLSPGDRLVVEGMHSFFAGQLVRPVSYEGTVSPRQ